ncbi:hypothetical protein O3M35_001230 [Rhynocoris fuscipes]|uniref:threonine--tRNA ligase n=1 Tax=Rhynocoris fuscipes TaxID=488301 RepID=A0AAW1DU52_9HEMI
MSGDGKSKDEDENLYKELDPWPIFIQERLELWNQFKEKYDAELNFKINESISITLPDGTVMSGFSWKTTPYEIAMEISESLADDSVIAKVDDELWDLDRPLEKDCKLKLLKFDDSEAETVFLHSSAHILGEALERTIGVHLCCSPQIQSGFYYDMFCPHRQIDSSDYPLIEEVAKKIIEDKQPFERLEISKEDLLEMFKYNKFKVRILNEKITTPVTTIYRCGSLIDLCRGPHIQHTGKVKAFKVTKNSNTYWEDDEKAEYLQRVYGISFPDDKRLKEWEQLQDESAKRDHRKIGKDQELFFFHELSPGACFFQPKGVFIYNTLIDFIRSEYCNRGYEEVFTPNIFNSKLWMTSGHYADDKFEVEKKQFALKPMNCPGHCLIFDNRVRSWRELPLRLADFGVFHRNDPLGALTDLTRVRRFQKDDAHIFCTVNQIKNEIIGSLKFMKHVYSILGFTFDICLSTRPKNFLGDINIWNEAERQLKESLNEFGANWKENSEDGSIYGPKIDITLIDSLKRPFQYATIQLDFQLPKRFNLNYIDENDEKKRPIIIHQAIFGSIERMIAILAENYAGKWPLWLSPRQIMVVPMFSQSNDYAEQVQQMLRSHNFLCDLNTEPDVTMGKKILAAQNAQYNFVFIVGENERKRKTIRLRSRNDKIDGEFRLDNIVRELKNIVNKKVLNCQ